MSDEQKGRSSGPYWALPVLALLPVLYVLSIGPVGAICLGAGASPEAFRAAYAPVVWLHDNTPLKGPLRRYVMWWGID